MGCCVGMSVVGALVFFRVGEKVAGAGVIGVILSMASYLHESNQIVKNGALQRKIIQAMVHSLDDTGENSGVNYNIDWFSIGK